MLYKIPKSVFSLLSAVILCFITAPVSAKVFVGNLSPAVSDEELTQLFSNYGIVRNASVSLDDMGLSKGFGFVDMANPSVEPDVIEKLNTTELLGNIIKVKLVLDDTVRFESNRYIIKAKKAYPDFPVVHHDDSPTYE